MIFCCIEKMKQRDFTLAGLCGAAGRDVTSFIRNPQFEPHRKKVEMKANIT